MCFLVQRELFVTSEANTTHQADDTRARYLTQRFLSFNTSGRLRCNHLIFFL